MKTPWENKVYKKFYFIIGLCTGFELKKPVFLKRNRFEKKTGYKLKRKKKFGFETGFKKSKPVSKNSKKTVFLDFIFKDFHEIKYLFWL